MANHAAARAVRSFAAKLATGTGVPGGIIAIADRSGLVEEICFGSASVSGAHPVTPEHRFEVGSISKTFVSLLIQRLADDELLSLDDAVTRHLPWVEFGSPDAPPADQPVTIRHLLQHTAGLVLGSDALPDDRAQIWALRELVQAGPVGARFHYSNLGYVLLGLVATAVTGRPMPELLHDLVMTPLGIPGALACVREGDRASFAEGSVPADESQPWAPGEPLAAAPWFAVAGGDGNVACTAAELARLGRLLVGDGSLDGRRVVSAGALQRMYTDLAPTGEDVLRWAGSPGATTSRYGLGVNVETIEGNTCLTHGGGMVGYASFLLADRDSGVSVAVLTNGNGDRPAAQVIARVAHDLYRAAPAYRPAAHLPDPDPHVSGPLLTPQMSGDFAGYDASGQLVEIQLAVDGEEPGGWLVLKHKGLTSGLYRTWSSGFVTDHPELRTFLLRFATDTQGPHWTWGPLTLRPHTLHPHIVGSVPGGPPSPAPDPYPGHYRCYSPWYPHLRIVRRGDRLLLIAPGGVEAPGEDEELIQLADGALRVGADSWLPERIVPGPIVDGQMIALDRDGCRYSRAFTD